MVVSGESRSHYLKLLKLNQPKSISTLGLIGSCFLGKIATPIHRLGLSRKVGLSGRISGSNLPWKGYQCEASAEHQATFQRQAAAVLSV